MKYTKKTVPLIILLKQGRVSEDDVKLLHMICVQRNREYLENYYNKNLRVRDDHVTELGILTPEISTTLHPRAKNIVRNMYLREIMLDTTPVHRNTSLYLQVMMDLFKYHVIDYKLITPSVLSNLHKGLFPSMMSGLYFRASILNPFIAYSVASKVFAKRHPTTPSTSAKKKPEFRVMTPTLGWSSYMIGLFNLPQVTHYVGIDVIPSVCRTTKRIQKAFFPNRTVDIHCTPSESLNNDSKFLSMYRDSVDFIFFSPPYYELELYKGKYQSTNTYKNYEEWLEGYWDPTIELCYKCLKKDRYMCYIISNYNHEGTSYNLRRDLNRRTKRVGTGDKDGFQLVKSIPLTKANVGFTKHRRYKEMIYVFKKK